MSKMTKRDIIAATTEDGRTIRFEKPVSVWQAMAQAFKRDRT